MQIRTLNVQEYRGCTIYYRSIGTVFEYIAVVRGKVYTSHITIRKTPWQLVTGRDHSEKELANIIKYLARYAETTVDYVLDQKK